MYSLHWVLTGIGNQCVLLYIWRMVNCWRELFISFASSVRVVGLYGLWVMVWLFESLFWEWVFISWHPFLNSKPWILFIGYFEEPIFYPWFQWIFTICYSFEWFIIDDNVFWVWFWWFFLIPLFNDRSEIHYVELLSSFEIRNLEIIPLWS